MADKDSNDANMSHAAGSGEEHPPQSVPGASYLKEMTDGQSVDIRLASAPYTTQLMNSAEVLSTTTFDNSAEHQQQQQGDAGTRRVARLARLELIPRQNRGSNRRSSAPYSSCRGRGRQSRQNSASTTATNGVGQQRPSSYSQGWNNGMHGSITMRGGQLGKTSMPPVRGQMFIVDLGQNNSQRSGSFYETSSHRMADKDSNDTNILHAAGSEEGRPHQSVPGTSNLKEITVQQSARIHLASAPYTTQSMNSAESLSTTTSDNSTEHQQQADAGALRVARPASLELVARQNRGSYRGTSAHYSSGRGRGRQSRQNSASTAATNDAGQQRQSSYSQGWNNGMHGSITMRGGQLGKTSLPTVRRQMFIADLGQNNSLRLGSALGNYMSFKSGHLNTVEMSFAMANWIDLGGGKSNRTVISRAEENVIDLRESQWSTLDLISGGVNVVNLSSAQGNRITVGSVNDHNRIIFDCGQGNQIILHTRWGASAEDIQFLRFGNHRLIWFRNNFIIQKPWDATLPNCFIHTVCNTFPSSGSVVYDGDNDDFRDAPTAMTSDDAKLLPTRRLFSTVAMHDKQCHVCRRDFENKCVSRILPCLHEFHMQCIDEYLSSNRFCPGCHQVVYGGA